jgi:hypothetical protein
MGGVQCRNHKVEVYESNDVYDFCLKEGNDNYRFTIYPEGDKLIIDRNDSLLFRDTYSKYKINPENAIELLNKLLKIKAFL